MNTGNRIVVKYDLVLRVPAHVADSVNMYETTCHYHRRGLQQNKQQNQRSRRRFDEGSGITPELPWAPPLDDGGDFVGGAGYVPETEDGPDISRGA